MRSDRGAGPSVRAASSPLRRPSCWSVPSPDRPGQVAARAAAWRSAGASRSVAESPASAWPASVRAAAGCDVAGAAAGVGCGCRSCSRRGTRCCGRSCCGRPRRRRTRCGGGCGRSRGARTGRRRTRSRGGLLGRSGRLDGRRLDAGSGLAPARRPRQRPRPARRPPERSRRRPGGLGDDRRLGSSRRDGLGLLDRVGRSSSGSGGGRGVLLTGRSSLRRAALLLLLVGLLLHRAEHHDHVAPVLLGHALDEAELGHVVRQPLEQAHAHLRARLLATAEHDHDLDLVAGGEEPLDVALLGAVVVRVDLQPETDLLEDRVRLVPPGLTGLHVCFVLELAVVHDLADGRTSVRGHLDEVEVGVLGQAQGVLHADDADLLAVGADQADLGDADPIVDAGLADVVLLRFVVGGPPGTRKAPVLVTGGGLEVRAVAWPGAMLTPPGSACAVRCGL